MNMFQIHDKDGKAININVLDQEACILWGTTLDKKSYASPYDKAGIYDKYMSGEYTYGKDNMKGEVAFYASMENWFDKIGWKIAYHMITSWKALKDDMLAVYRKYNISDEELMTDTRIWGFIELIDLWESKGYIPVCMDENYTILSKNGVRTAVPEDTTPSDEEQRELDTLHAAHSVDMDHIRS